jgi:3-hydroxyacyl-[acyl-carrier-protein] dehydratase
MENQQNLHKASEIEGKIAPGAAVMGFDEIRNLLPQKEPFIFVDKVLELQKGERIVCLKNISGNDPWFRGHFPNFAVMPGVLIIEALAQSALILARKSDFNHENNFNIVLGSVKARFLKPVVPGEQLIMEIKIDKVITRGAVVSAVAKVDGKEVVTASMAFGLV